jgi:hypothetical protein
MESADHCADAKKSDNACSNPERTARKFQNIPHPWLPSTLNFNPLE